MNEKAFNPDPMFRQRKVAHPAPTKRWVEAVQQYSISSLLSGARIGIGREHKVLAVLPEGANDRLGVSCRAGQRPGKRIAETATRHKLMPRRGSTTPFLEKYELRCSPSDSCHPI